jgi:hypothetical protein
MKAILMALLVAVSSFAAAQQLPAIPPNAVKYIPNLAVVLKEEWPEMKSQSIVAGQIEKESCITLKHRGCWNPTTELKTPYEYGFGLGQLTIAYKNDGSVRFNNFDEMRKRFPSLREWKWENRYDPSYQMRTMVLMDKGLYNEVKWPVASQQDQFGFMLSGYNGGMGGVRQDRILCTKTPGCDPSRWFDHVEKNSFKTRIKKPGYGQSAYEINRGYVRIIMFDKRKKYMPYFPD